MRFVITADLHYRPSQRDRYERFADAIAAQQPDCLVIAGDLGHPLRLFQRSLQVFARLDCPRFVIAGNHDVYRGELDSRALWETGLPGMADAEGFVWLEGTAHRLGHVGLCGSMAWYDYSELSQSQPCGQRPFASPRSLDGRGQAQAHRFTRGRQQPGNAARCHPGF